jgi:nucleoside phosphorylase
LDWKKKLKNKVLQLARAKCYFIESLENSNKYHVGVICALSEEFDQLQKAFVDCKWEDCRIVGLPWLFKTTTVATSGFKELKVIAACADSPGVCSTSILATALYTVAKVDAVFMTGITAGVDYDDLRLDDVIIAESVLDYATGKLKEEDKKGEIEWLREIHQVNASSQLLSLATSLARESEICEVINHELREKNLKDDRDNVQFRKAKTVCGPFVVASGSLVDVLKNDERKLQALDMEGFGLYLTAHNLGKQALWIKAVCDFADVRKSDDHHKCCAYVSAAFLYQLLREKY